MTRPGWLALCLSAWILAAPVLAGPPAAATSKAGAKSRKATAAELAKILGIPLAEAREFEAEGMTIEDAESLVRIERASSAAVQKVVPADRAAAQAGVRAIGERARAEAARIQREEAAKAAQAGKGGSPAAAKAEADRLFQQLQAAVAGKDFAAFDQAASRLRVLLPESRDPRWSSPAAVEMLFMQARAQAQQGKKEAALETLRMTLARIDAVRATPGCAPETRKQLDQLRRQVEVLLQG